MIAAFGVTSASEGWLLLLLIVVFVRGSVTTTVSTPKQKKEVEQKKNGKQSPSRHQSYAACCSRAHVMYVCACWCMCVLAVICRGKMACLECAIKGRKMISFMTCFTAGDSHKQMHTHTRTPTSKTTLGVGID